MNNDGNIPPDLGNENDLNEVNEPNVVEKEEKGSRNYKAPPPFLEGADFLKWQSNIEIWTMLTSVSPKKQGPEVFLVLHEKAQDVCRSLGKQLGTSQGLVLLMGRLESLYLQDKDTRSYQAFKTFHNYKRSSGESMQQFVASFETLYGKLEEFKMVLPEAVQAYFLLSAANISEEDEKLTRATVG